MQFQDLVEKVTHIECMMCQNDKPVDTVDRIKLQEFQDLGEFMDVWPMMCCHDPYPQMVIRSEEPLFPTAEDVDDDYYDHGTGRYEYELSDDFLDAVGVE